VRIAQPPIDVLLVDDNSDDAEFTLRALQRAESSLQVTIAEDGVAALDFMFCTGRYQSRVPAAPRVVLLDLKLPKIDGLEVLRRLKADARTRSVPVVVLTSSKERRDIHEAYVRGANSYLVKPVEYVELVAKLQDLIRYWLKLNQSMPDR
jgi:two-component system response regulator